MIRLGDSVTPRPGVEICLDEHIGILGLYWCDGDPITGKVVAFDDHLNEVQVEFGEIKKHCWWVPIQEVTRADVTIGSSV